MKCKRLCSLFLSLIMVISLCSVTVFADGAQGTAITEYKVDVSNPAAYVIKNSGNYYLDENITGYIIVNAVGDVEIDLNGKNITSSSSSSILKSVRNEAGISAGFYSSTISVFGGNVVINDSVGGAQVNHTVNTQNANVLFVNGESATVTVNGGTYTQTGSVAQPIQCNQDATLIINDATVNGGSGQQCIYNGAGCTTTINGGTFNGEDAAHTGGVENWGALEITGGTFDGGVTVKSSSSSSSTTNITGGNFGAGITIGAGSANTIEITGGTFPESAMESVLTYVPAQEEYQDVNNQNGTHTITPPAANVAKIGDVEYATLADAIAAVLTDGTATTITMLADENIDVAAAPLTVAAGQNIVLDLNGKKIIGTCDSGITSAMITNKGTLTIQDSSTGGQLVYNPTNCWTYSAANPGGYASNLIRNEGTLTVEGGTLYNSGDGSAAYAIDNYGSGSVTVNGGTIDTAKSSAIRMFYNNGGSLAVTDGTIGHY